MLTNVVLDSFTNDDIYVVVERDTNAGRYMRKLVRCQVTTKVSVLRRLSQCGYRWMFESRELHEAELETEVPRLEPAGAHIGDRSRRGVEEEKKEETEVSYDDELTIDDLDILQTCYF